VLEYDFFFLTFVFCLNRAYQKSGQKMYTVTFTCLWWYLSYSS